MPDASNIGFLLNVSLSLTETFFWWYVFPALASDEGFEFVLLPRVRMVNSVEVEGSNYRS